MGSSKSKAINIEMRLRSGTTYNEQAAEMERDSDDHEVNDERTPTQGRWRALEQPGASNELVQRHFESNHHFVNVVPLQNIQTSRRWSFWQRVIGQTSNGVSFAVRSIPVLLGIIGGVSVLIDFVFEPNVQIHEITVTVAPRHGWLYNYFFGTEEELREVATVGWL